MVRWFLFAQAVGMETAAEPQYIDQGGCTPEVFSKWYYRILRFGSLGISLALVLCSITGFSSMFTDYLGLGARGLFFQFVFALIGLYAFSFQFVNNIICVRNLRHPLLQYLGHSAVYGRVCIPQVSSLFWISAQTYRSSDRSFDVRLYFNFLFFFNIF
jgi:hypothetical protein